MLLGLADENGPQSDRMIPILLDAAKKYKIKVSIYKQQTLYNYKKAFFYFLIGEVKCPKLYCNKISQSTIKVLKVTSYWSWAVKAYFWLIYGTTLQRKILISRQPTLQLTSRKPFSNIEFEYLMRF